MAEQKGAWHDDHSLLPAGWRLRVRGGGAMTRLLLFLLFAIAAAGVTLGLKSCQERRTILATATPGFGAQVAILGDGTPLFAPNGTIARTITDWLADPTATRRYFEVGGRQFVRGTEPVPEAKARLTRLAAMLQAYPDVEAEVIGFARPTADPAADAQRAADHAQRVIDLLVADGVRRSRLSIGAPPPGQPRSDRIALMLVYPDR